MRIFLSRVGLSFSSSKLPSFSYPTTISSATTILLLPTSTIVSHYSVSPQSLNIYTARHHILSRPLIRALECYKANSHITDWQEEDTQLPGGNSHLWEESWDDDDTNEEFAVQLKYVHHLHPIQRYNTPRSRSKHIVSCHLRADIARVLLANQQPRGPLSQFVIGQKRTVLFARK